jgi:hypothetical protein
MAMSLIAESHLADFIIYWNSPPSDEYAVEPLEENGKPICDWDRPYWDALIQKWRHRELAVSGFVSDTRENVASSGRPARLPLVRQSSDDSRCTSEIGWELSTTVSASLSMGCSRWPDVQSKTVSW